MRELASIGIGLIGSIDRSSPRTVTFHLPSSIGQCHLAEGCVGSANGAAVRAHHFARVHRCGNANNCEWQNRLPSSQIKPNPEKVTCERALMIPMSSRPRAQDVNCIEDVPACPLRRRPSSADAIKWTLVTGCRVLSVAVGTAELPSAQVPLMMHGPRRALNSLGEMAGRQLR